MSSIVKKKESRQGIVIDIPYKTKCIVADNSLRIQVQQI